MLNLINGVGDYLINGSILHALDANRLLQESAKYANSSVLNNAITGIFHGAVGIPKELLISRGLSFLLSASLCKLKISKSIPITFDSMARSSKTIVIVAAIVEEICFRGLLQNSISLTQNTFQAYSPEYLSDSKQFNWIFSPSLKILLVNTIFALSHMSKVDSNPNRRLSKMIQFLRIVLRPNESILHHTTGNIVAPIFSHIVNNLISVFIEKNEIKNGRDIESAVGEVSNNF